MNSPRSVIVAFFDIFLQTAVENKSGAGPFGARAAFLPFSYFTSGRTSNPLVGSPTRASSLYISA